jgi:hypothetical protein
MEKLNYTVKRVLGLDGKLRSSIYNTSDPEIDIPICFPSEDCNDDEFCSSCKEKILSLVLRDVMNEVMDEVGRVCSRDFDYKIAFISLLESLYDNQLHQKQADNMFNPILCNVSKIINDNFPNIRIPPCYEYSVRNNRNFFFHHQYN